MILGSWSLLESDEIVELNLDVRGERHNVLSREVLSELDQILAVLEGRPLRGLVIRSGKPQSFIVGTDVRQFRRILDAARAAELTRAAQLVLARLNRLPYPSVAAIRGACLGGGLELALACTYRIGCDDERTIFGMPEVKLGIHPGFGGTVRLPALIGPLPALSLMLSGRTLGVRRASDLGLVDGSAPERHMTTAARALLMDVPPRGRPPWHQEGLAMPFFRPYVAAILRRQLRAHTDCRHYPAPCRILSLWGRQASFEAEALSCAELLVSPVSRHLVRLFEVSEEIKRGARAQPHRIKRIHVIGAGVMGADIAAWAALKGFSVSLEDREPKTLALAVQRAHALLAERLTDRALQAARDRLLPDVKGKTISTADLVVEAVPENRETKTALFKEIEARVADSVIVATNTATIPIEELAADLAVPERLVGLHFFRPVSTMQLVEVVAGAHTGTEVLARMRSLVLALDRLPVDVRSGPGFLVNRVLLPYVLEAVMLVEEGADPAQVDGEAVAFGMPMGPLAWVDMMGLDVCLLRAQGLSAALGFVIPPLLVSKVSAGLVGLSCGRGFYSYPRKRTLRPFRPRPADPLIAERLIMRLVNEAARALRAGVVADADVLDIGLVYGTGFAPFKGGPFGYAETLGPAEMRGRLNELRTRFGDRFAPDPSWSSDALFRRRALGS